MVVKNGIRRYPFHWRLLLPMYWPIWFGAGVLTLLWLLPARIKSGLARKTAPLAMKAMQRQVHYAKTNISLCFPQWSETQRTKLLNAYFTNQTRTVLDMPLCWWLNKRGINRQVELHDTEAVDALVADGKPVIFLVCHSLTLEHTARALTYRYPMMGYVKHLKNPAVDWLVNHSRLKGDGVLFQRGLPLRALIKQVRAGSILYYFSDEDLGLDSAVFSPFFAQEKATLTSLPKLARLSDATVVPIYGWFDEASQRYQVKFLPAFDPAGDASEKDFAKRLNEQLAEMILLQPDAYMWKLRLFKTVREGKPPVY